MTVIACLMISPTESICAACARLTPVVEPQSDRVFMDWTGCGPVPELARRLDKELRASFGGDPLGGGTDSPPPHRLGVAPLRFVAELLAQKDAAFAGEPSPPGPAAAPRRRPSRPKAPTASDLVPIVGGWYVPPSAVSGFIGAVPVDRLPGIDEKTRQALAALAIRVLGDLRRIRIGLLRSHVGDAAEKLLARARGLDPRPVESLYPPERLSRRISGEHLADVLLAAGPDRLPSFIEAAATPLLRQLQETNRAATHLTVHCRDARRMRTFAEPVADPDQLVRAVLALTRQLLSESDFPPTGKGDLADQFFVWHDLMVRDDLVIEIVPAPGAIRQMTFWDGGRPRNARQRRLQTVLDSLRDRFGDAIGPATPRKAVARYEAMLHLYGAKG